MSGARWKKAYRCAMALLCVCLCVYTGTALTGLLREGAARRQEGDALAAAFTRQNLQERLTPSAVMLALAVLFTLAGRVLVLRGGKEQTVGENPAVREYSACPATRRTAAVRAVLLAAAVALILLGIFSGGWRDVLVKAINLCTECVGLG